MALTDNITKEILKERLSYNKKTGNFYWKKCKCSRMKKGSLAGAINKQGYWQITIDDVRYYAHRLAFLYIKGYMPAQVDHIDQNPSNNSWANLREADYHINTLNLSKYKNNTSGFNGVYHNKSSNSWYSRITVKGEEIYLGTFKNINDAIAARKAANKKYGFHKNHGKTESIVYEKYREVRR